MLGGFCAAAALMLLASCATSTLGRFKNEFPDDIPKEVLEKFQVKDAVTGPAEPVAPQTPEPKGKRKKKGAKTPNPAPGGFSIPMRRLPQDPIWEGERQVHEISYLGIPAAKFELTVLPFKMIGTRKAYHIQGNLQSYAVFNMVYRLNDTVETYMDYDGLFSHRYHLVQDESGQARDQLELYDSEKRQMFYWNRHRGKDGPMNEQREFAAIQPFVQDYVSAFYSARSQPWDPGFEYVFPMAHEKKQVEGVVSFVRRETIRTILGKIPAVVVRPRVRENGEFKGSSEIYIWFSDDSRRVVLKLEAKVKVGSVFVTLREYSPGQPPELSTAAPTPAPSATPTLPMPSP